MAARIAIVTVKLRKVTRVRWTHKGVPEHSHRSQGVSMKLKHSIIIALAAAAAALGLIASPALAQSGHFITSGAGAPTCTDIGLQVTCTGKVAGLGGTTFEITVMAPGIASVSVRTPAATSLQDRTLQSMWRGPVARSRHRGTVNSYSASRRLRLRHCHRRRRARMTSGFRASWTFRSPLPPSRSSRMASLRTRSRWPSVNNVDPALHGTFGP